MEPRTSAKYATWTISTSVSTLSLLNMHVFKDNQQFTIFLSANVFSLKCSSGQRHFVASEVPGSNLSNNIDVSVDHGQETGDKTEVKRHTFHVALKKIENA